MNSGLDIASSIIEAAKAGLPWGKQVRYARVDPAGFAALEANGRPLYGVDSRGRVGVYVPAPAMQLFDFPLWRADQVLVVPEAEVQAGNLMLYEAEPSA